jgi:hypothetical protein
MHIKMCLLSMQNRSSHGHTDIRVKCFITAALLKAALKQNADESWQYDDKFMFH